MPTTKNSRIPTAEEAALIRGMLQRGDYQHDIAAYFGMNQGRISEVKNFMRHADVHAAAEDQLPPAGPYVAPKAA